MSKKMMVKGVSVVVSEKYLEFEKNGELVKLEREFGKSDYSLVFLELNRKNEKRLSNGVKKLGSYSYKVDENNVVSIWNKKGELILEKEVEEVELKYPRIYCTNWILERGE